MTTSQIDEALAQVRRMRELVGDRQQFRGYSGCARWSGGTVTVLCALLLTQSWVPENPRIHLLFWGLAAVASALSNYGVLVYKLWKEGKLWMRSEVIPVVDAFPPLAVAGVMTVALVMRGQYDMLFGSWMLLYGLVHVVYRRNLPVGNYFVGVWYLFAGTLCVLSPQIEFMNPVPMALVFGLGELSGGMVLHRRRDQQEKR